MLITVDPKLLREADAYVEKIGETRAGWIQKLMREAMKPARARSGAKRLERPTH